MKMRKRFCLMMAILLALAAPAAALAEGQIAQMLAEMAGAKTSATHAVLVDQQPLERSVYLSSTTNTYYVRSDNGYVLCDAEGQVISAEYADISALYDSTYYTVNNGGGINGEGLIDSTGKEVIPLSYGDIKAYGDHWILGITLEATTDEKGDYHDLDQNQYNVTGVDVYFDLAKIGTLARSEYPGNYSIGAHGSYLYIGVKNDEMLYLSPSFEKTTYKDDYVSYYSEYDEVYRQGVFHRPTNQQVFVPGCTLTPDQVDQAVWYNDDGDFIDLQGNVISQGVSPDEEYDHVYYDGGEYLRVVLYGDDGSKDGLVNMKGEEVLSPLYDDLGGSLYGDYYALGYQAVLEDGALKYFDLDGNVTAATSYKMDASDYNGFSDNAPMIAIKNLGQVIVVTATAGELPQRYEDYKRCDTYQRVMAVQLDDMWGVIGMDGETVIPFELTSQPSISYDGTLIIGRTEAGYVRYTIAYTGEAAAAPAAGIVSDEESVVVTPAADGGWVCPTCGQTVTTNFCPNDGTAKPTKVACQNCGYEPADGVAPNFCPNCGAKFQ